MSGENLVGVVLAVACALLIFAAPAVHHFEARHQLRAWRRRRDEAARGGTRGLSGASGPADPASRLARLGQDAMVGLLVSEVASRLRAGETDTHAWSLSWQRYDGLGELGEITDGVPYGVRRMARGAQWGDLREEVSWQTLRDIVGARRADRAAKRRAGRALVAACSFSNSLGAPLAEVLEAVADGIDESRAAEDACRSAHAGPRASARVLTLLPLLGVVIGEMLGAHPLGQFVSGGVGTVCAVVGIAFLIGGHLCISRMLARAQHEGGVGIDEAILCDLMVAGLNSGASIPTVLEALGACSGMGELSRISKELVLGASWGRAWHPCPDSVQIVRDTAEPAWVSGTSPVSLLQRAAAQIRSRRVADARIGAEKLGVRLVLPLGTLLLPAFIALGIVPMMIHLAGSGIASIVP